MPDTLEPIVLDRTDGAISGQWHEIATSEGYRPAGWFMGGGITVTADATPALMEWFHAGHSRHPWSRCRICNPRGNPGKLPVDGHEYRRRQKARKRRKR